MPDVIIEVAMIEDSEAAHNLVAQCFEKPRSLGSTTFCLKQGSKAISSENRAGLVDSLRSHRGPLVLIVDLDLSMEPGIRQNTKEVIKAAIGDDYDGNKALDEALGFSSDAVFIDGVEFGVIALQCQEIRPLMVRVASRQRSRGQAVTILRAVGRRYRPNDECWDVGDLGNSSVAELTQFKDQLPADELFKRLVDREYGAIGESLARFSKCFVGCSDSLEHLDRYLANVKDVHAENDLATWARTYLLPLVCISEKCWEMLWSALSPAAHDVLTSSGSTATNGLGIAAGWLFALSAYQHADGRRPWQTVFQPSQLGSLPAGMSWRNQLMTPKLNCKGRPTSSLDKAIQHYYWMCVCLFRREGQGEVGPLQKVTLSADGMSFHLSFDAWQVKPSPARNLSENISLWRSGYLKNVSGGQHDWSQAPADGPNATARAIWNWWLATSVHDYPSGDDAIFDSRDVRKTILRRDRGTTVVEFR